MKVSRIDDSTINCIITQDDMTENGIDLDDLLQKRPKAMDYLRRVILAAAEAENFSIAGEFTSMQVRVMKDQSVSLTLSQGKRPETSAADAVVQAAQAAVQAQSGGTADPTGKADNQRQHQNPDQDQRQKDPVRPAVYLFTFESIADAASCCRKVPDAAKLPSSLYQDEREGGYYLLFSSPGDDEVKFEKTILAMNEFGTFVEASSEEVAYIMEHQKCILKDTAARQLAKL